MVFGTHHFELPLCAMIARSEKLINVAMDEDVSTAVYSDSPGTEVMSSLAVGVDGSLGYILSLWLAQRRKVPTVPIT